MFFLNFKKFFFFLVFDFAKFAIANKVQKSYQTSPQFQNKKLKLSQILACVNNLSSVKLLEKSYLNPKTKNVKKLLQLLEATSFDENEDEIIRKSDKDLKNPREEVISIVGEEEEEEEDVEMKDENVNTSNVNVTYSKG